MSAFLPDPPLELDLTTPELTELARPPIATALDHCAGVLKRNDLDWSDVIAIVTAGAATRAPAIRKLLSDQVPLHDAATTPELAVVLGLLAPPATPFSATEPPPVPEHGESGVTVGPRERRRRRAAARWA